MKPINEFEEVLEKFGEVQAKALRDILHIRHSVPQVQDAQLHKVVTEFHYFTRTMLERFRVFQWEIEQEGRVIPSGKSYQRA